MPLTRFSPMVLPKEWYAGAERRHFMHLGHLWCAFYNWAFGDEEGILLRFGDITFVNGGRPHKTESCQEFLQDFRDGLARFGIPVVKEIMMSDRLERYDEVNESRFQGSLDWSLGFWPVTIGAYGIYNVPADINDQPYGWHVYSSPMMELTRVVDDYDYGVTDVIRGLELAMTHRVYSTLGKIAYPDVPDWKRPKLRAIPEVMELTMAEDTKKISKSVSRQFFLGDYNLNPVKALCGLAAKQLLCTSVNGTYLIPERTSIQELREWVKLSRDNTTPKHLTVEEVQSWS